VTVSAAAQRETLVTINGAVSTEVVATLSAGVATRSRRHPPPVDGVPSITKQFERVGYAHLSGPEHHGGQLKI
jgi:hypothetical protein